MPNPVSHLYEFDEFRLDVRTRRLLRGDAVVPLTPKAFDTLLALVTSHGRVVEKDDLLRTVWPDTSIEEGALSRNIYLLRRALGESPNDHRYIVTAPGRGYRFVATVVERQTEQAPTSDVEAVETPRAGHRAVRSVRVAAFALAGLIIVAGVVWSLASPPARLTAADVRTLAVLPFTTLGSGKGEEDYLGLGMADALITRLGNLQQVVVRPTSAVLKYADGERDPQAVAAALKADAVLDGTVQRHGDRVRITARLLSASRGETIWTSQFDEPFTDLFAVEDQLSDRLAQALAPALTGDEKRQLARVTTRSSIAYQAHLRGRYFWSRWNRVALEKAVAAFEEALRADPNYAPAWAGLADAYTLLGYRGSMPPRQAFPKAESAAVKALALDNNLGEAHAALAKARLFYEWDWKGAEREITRALALSPNDADAHALSGAYRLAIGDFAGALRERMRALDLDPASPLMITEIGWVYFYDHRYDEAIAWYHKALDLDPNFNQTRGDLFNALYHKGSYDEAIDETLRIRTLNGAPFEVSERIKRAYAAGGIRGYWRSELEIVESDIKAGRIVSPWRAARIHAALGDRDSAFMWLDRAYEERASLLTFLKTTPLFDVLHDDPRFGALVRRLGTPRF